MKPLVREILTDPQLFASIDEPNMIKSPVVFVSRRMRAIGLGVSSWGRPITSTRWGSSPTSRRPWRAGSTGPRG